MVKIKPLLFALLGTLTISAIDIPDHGNEKPVFNTRVVLSRFTSDDDLVIPVSITKFSSSTYKLVFSIYNAATDAKVYTKTYKGSEIGTSLPVNFDIDLPIKNRLKADGLRLEFVHYLKGLPYRSETGVIYPFQKQQVNVAAFRREPFIAKGNYLEIVDHKVYSDEIYDFTNLNEYLSFSQSNKLDLSNISFKFTSSSPFNCHNITLNIRDYKSVFPDIEKNNNLITLKMKYTQIDDDVTLSLDEELYVNVDTLEMSQNPKDNYVETDSVFVPTNKEDDFMGDEMFIRMVDCGYSLSDFNIPFNFYFSKKYVGECHESDYCIHGGIKE